MDHNDADRQSNELKFLWEEVTPEYQANVSNPEQYRSSSSAFPALQPQSVQNEYPEESRSAELADNGTLPSSPGNGIYLSPNSDFRRDSIRSMSIVDDSGMRTRRNIKRNGTLPNLSKGTSSPAHQPPPFLHNYLQVPQSQSARSNSSVASMQSDLESCIGDAQYPSDLIEGKVIERIASLLDGVALKLHSIAIEYYLLIRSVSEFV